MRRTGLLADSLAVETSPPRNRRVQYRPEMLRLPPILGTVVLHQLPAAQYQPSSGERSHRIRERQLGLYGVPTLMPPEERPKQLRSQCRLKEQSSLAHLR